MHNDPREPLVEAVSLTAAPPSLADNTGDADRLLRAVRQRWPELPVAVPYCCLSRVAAAFRQAGFAGSAICNVLDRRIEVVDFVPGSAPGPVGMALDLGTTHLAAELIDLASGAVLARAGRENSQIRYGADILSRIHYAGQADGLTGLHETIVADIDQLAALLARQAGLTTGAIRALAVAGNTTMVHLLLCLDPYHLCREPYIPVVNAPAPINAHELGLALHPMAPVWVLPSVGAYFGGDLTAGIIASSMWRSSKTAMLIDVGTNAEVVVGNREWLIACAGAAGPALEGGIARMGMRAGPGAIERVAIDPDSGKVTYSTIDGASPEGICGSGIIDLAAALYLARIIDVRGKFRPSCGHPQLQQIDGQWCFVIAGGNGPRPVQVCQVDLDAMMRSKAAMYAILTTLLGQVGLSFAELENIFVAGAFGQHINPRSAIVLGMLPDLPEQVFQGIGNSSLAGAGKILLSGAARQAAGDVVRRITYLELNVNHEFMNRFSGCRFIPHTDHSLFPSVPFYG